MAGLLAWLAQLVEHLICKQGGRGFESCIRCTFISLVYFSVEEGTAHTTADSVNGHLAAHLRPCRSPIVILGKLILYNIKSTIHYKY